MLHKFQKEILCTADYAKFQIINGNRRKKVAHLERLKKSMEENYLFTIIIVNEKFEIIDGQHRFHCLLELGLPVYYIICEGYGIDEVQRYNINSKDWQLADHLHSYCERGITDYLKFDEFIKRHKIPINVGLMLLCNTDGGPTTNAFKNGTLKIRDINKANNNALKLKQMSQYCEHVYERGSISALSYLLTHPFFIFDELLKKLAIYGELKKQGEKSNWISAYEKVYNYGRREKVNLQFIPKEKLILN